MNLDKWTIKPGLFTKFEAVHDDYECDLVDGDWIGNGLLISTDTMEELMENIIEIENESA